MENLPYDERLNKLLRAETENQRIYDTGLLKRVLWGESKI